MTNHNRGPDAGEMAAIVQRLHRTLSGDGLTGDQLLQVEMTLRGMLPDLEARLQQHALDDPDHDADDGAVEGLMHLAATLMWVQLHAQEPPAILRRHLTEAVSSAQQVVAYLEA